jgi:hypothetical protein
MAPDQAQYEAWIANTRVTQRKLKLGLALLAIISIALLFVSKIAGAVGIVSCILFGVFGFWITSSHVTGWHTEIDRLSHPRGELNRDGRLKRERD